MSPPNESPPVERRRNPRFEITAQVRLRKAAESHVLEVGNISLSGLWVRVPDDKLLRRVRPAERLDLELSSPWEPRPIAVSVRVARIVFTGAPATHGIGLEFHRLGAAAQEAVERMVSQVAARRPPPIPRPSQGPPPLPSNDPFVFAEPEFRDG